SIPTGPAHWILNATSWAIRPTTASHPSAVVAGRPRVIVPRSRPSASIRATDSAVCLGPQTSIVVLLLLCPDVHRLTNRVGGCLGCFGVGQVDSEQPNPDVRPAVGDRIPQCRPEDCPGPRTRQCNQPVP